MSVYSYTYSSAYSPAAPVVDVIVYSPGSPENNVGLSLLLDSGADVTVLPVRVLNRIDAEYLETAILYGVAGGRTRVDVYRVALQLGPHTVNAVHVVGVLSTSNIVLGRDVLNQLSVTLNGPANMTEIEG